MENTNFENYNTENVLNFFFDYRETTNKEKQAFETIRNNQKKRLTKIYKERFYEKRPLKQLVNKDFRKFLISTYIEGLYKEIHFNFIKAEYLFYINYNKVAKYIATIDILKEYTETQTPEIDILRQNIEFENKEQKSINKLKWHGSQNELITIFYDLMYMNLINGTKETLINMLNTFFIDKDNKPFTKSYIRNGLKPKTKRSRERADFSSLG